jgi:hypothetical protein
MRKTKCLAVFFVALLISSGPIGSMVYGMGSGCNFYSVVVLIGLLAAAYQFPPIFIRKTLQWMERQHLICFIARSLTPVIPTIVSSEGPVMAYEAIFAFFTSTIALFSTTASRVAILEPVCLYSLIGVWQLLALHRWLEAIYLTAISALAYAAKEWRRNNGAEGEREDHPLFMVAVVV